MINIPGDIFTDTLVLSLGSFIGYFVKVVFKPSQAEAKLISRILIGLSMAVISFLRRYLKEHHGHLDNISSEGYILKSKLNSSKIDGIG